MENVLSVVVGGLLALGLAVVVRERFPSLHRGWRARQGRRPILGIGALLAWAVVGTFGLMAVVSLLALVFPDGEWEARPSDTFAMLTWTGLGAALALPLSLWWWRSTAPTD
ncbi:hypothetical protein [Actinopolymorpha sp. B17G11]|uniref:hypothetical protein n=1 Tax=Actinopolymorpha sp. B17G11 TaxID=3160861 RepID=UPI0032E42699